MIDGGTAAPWIAAALLFGVCHWVFRVGTPRRL
ncbi:MAG: hypothetical protein QOD95_2450 [Gammaproteobacteria bacterium]|jgi:hypothetical protein|nr:hypothetical protein [Gammaproteobacteria bacterium]